MRPFLFSLLLLGVFLCGCAPVFEPPTPARLLFSLAPDRLTVNFRVVNARAELFSWDFGDGRTTETTVPEVSHIYSEVKAYLVVVRGFRGSWGGDGGPGPGLPGQRTEVFRLTEAVDLRPPILVKGLVIEPVDPPPWYRPGSPAFPPWHFPAHVALRFRLIYEVVQPGAKFRELHWEVRNDYGQLLAQANQEEWVWHEALAFFRLSGCPPRKAKYLLILTLRCPSGEEKRLRQEFYACGSSGC